MTDNKGKRLSIPFAGVIRYGPWIALDGLLATVAFAIALILRFGGRVDQYYLGWFLKVWPIIAVTYCLTNLAFNLYRRAWRYASLHDLVHLTEAVLVASTALLLADALFYPLDHPVPLSVIPVGGAITYLAMAVVKFSPRLRRFLLSGSFPRGGVGVLIVGAGQTGQLLAREMLRNHEWNYQPVCFVDDDPTKRGLRVHGVPVRGSCAEIPRLVEAYGASVVALAMPSASSTQLRNIVDICQPLPARLLVLRGIPEILQGDASSIGLREMRIEDLLGREPVEVDLEACRSYLTGRAVLVTGAAGSIGSELSRQIIALEPAVLILFDNNESGVHDLALELTDAARATRVLPCVGSVTNKRKVENVLNRCRPSVVFHAAAYKHVPLMEEYPEEAVAVNALGTLLVGDAAHNFGVERFVLVSTDKAVNPSNVMGATKRLAELIIKDLSCSSDTIFCAVRFGNVLGSRGSVVPTFTGQIDKGGPITITDPGATRYFMTIPEAASLIIQAGSFASPGDVFVLDMGEQVRILDLAEKMVRFRGLRIGTDIKVVFTGLRPGEKLTEELVDCNENVSRTNHPKVLRLNGHRASSGILSAVAELETLVIEGNPGQIRACLMEVVGTESVPIKGFPGAVGNRRLD